MTIKETAGKVLLYFYQLHRTVPASMPYRQLGFMEKKDGRMSVNSDKKWLTGDLLRINSSSSDIYNAFSFLIDKGYIASRERATGGTKIFVGIRLTDLGIDMVESIEQGKDGRDDFTRAFNIAVPSGMDVENLIKESLSVLLAEPTE